MKKHTPLIAFTLLALAFTGCSKHSPTGAFPSGMDLAKGIDLGTIDISGGKPNSQVLADGRGFIITPTVQPGGNVDLEVTVLETNTSGVKRLSRSLQLPGGSSDQAVTITVATNVFKAKIHM